MPHNITLVRRQNVLALFQSYAKALIASGAPPKGLEQAFAAALQISPSMWSQIKSSRPIGDKLARQLEKLGGKSVGWLDQPNTLSLFDAKPVESLRADESRAMYDNVNARVNKFALLAAKWHIKAQLLPCSQRLRNLDINLRLSPNAQIAVACPDLRNKKNGIAAEIGIVLEGFQHLSEIAVIGAVTQAASHWAHSLPEEELRKLVWSTYTKSENRIDWINIVTAKSVELVVPKILAWLDNRGTNLISAHGQAMLAR